MGRQYDYPKMETGECRIVADEESAAVASGVKEGQIIFMKLHPINLLTFVNDYEKEMLPKGAQPIMTGMTQLTDR